MQHMINGALEGAGGAKQSYQRFSVADALLIASIGLLIGWVFYDGLAYMFGDWLGREEYSHGILIPFITGFLIWQQKQELALTSFSGSWFGVVLVLAGLAIFLVGELAALFIIVQYSFLLTVCGVTLAICSLRIFKQVVIPLLLLFFAIPLPNFIYQGLSAKLQLWSSTLGVSFIRLCDITVFQEGNVIDLGAMQLQVVEACSGLRYLFPLMSLAFICAYFYKVSFWKRAVVFLSSIPITILMNSFRIGVIGVTVEYFGKEAAEGFLHDFEGWIVFMACTAILLVEMLILARVGNDPRPLQEVFGVTFPEPFPPGTQFQERELPKQFWVAGVMLLVALGLSMSLEHREEIITARAQYADFPLKLDEWAGRREIMEEQYVEELKFDDYILADYVREQLGPVGEEAAGVDPHPDSPPARGREKGTPVNFYSAYYASQRKGESIHSPRSCIPGGGWQITSHEVIPLDGLALQGDTVKVNRLLIQKGEDRQLVYYWFQQRGRNLTNEYVIKWYLFWDALTMNRTDGALVRLTTFAPKGEDIADADARLQDFLKVALPELDKYIPR